MFVLFVCAPARNIPGSPGNWGTGLTSLSQAAAVVTSREDTRTHTYRVYTTHTHTHTHTHTYHTPLDWLTPTPIPYTQIVQHNTVQHKNAYKNAHSNHTKHTHTHTPLDWLLPSLTLTQIQYKTQMSRNMRIQTHTHTHMQNNNYIIIITITYYIINGPLARDPRTLYT